MSREQAAYMPTVGRLFMRRRRRLHPPPDRADAERLPYRLRDEQRRIFPSFNFAAAAGVCSIELLARNLIYLATLGKTIY